MLTIYIDILGRLINDLVWEVSQIDIAQNSVQKYCYWSKVGLKAMTASHLRRQNSWVRIVLKRNRIL